MRWRAFTIELLEFAERLGVDDVRHARRAARRRPAHPADPGHRPPSDDEDSIHRFDLEPSRVRGPDRHRRRPAATPPPRPACPRCRCWAAVPHYVGAAAVAQGDARAAAPLEDLLDVTVPLGELPEDARAWERGVDELAEDDDEVAEYVQSLEEAQDTAELPEASGDAIAREFERYLRRRGDEPQPEPRASTRSMRAGAGPTDAASGAHRRQRAAQRRTPSRASTVRETSPGRRVVAAAVQALAGPAVDRRQRARGVEVVGEARAHPGDASRRRPDRRCTDSASRQRRQPLAAPRRGRSSVHSQSSR